MAEERQAISDFIASLPSNNGELGQRILGIHAAIRRLAASITRIACALYDESSGELRTFIDSTKHGISLQHYSYRITPKSSLHAIVTGGKTRVIDDILASIDPGSRHSNWLIQQGYRSSFTVPLQSGSRSIGVVFYDADLPDVFKPGLQRDLMLYTNLLSMAITSELSAVQYMVASARVAREFANLRDFETGAHLERMSRYSVIIGRENAVRFGFSDEHVEHLGIFAPLHDIGKIGIPDNILLKPGKLDAQEWDVMRTHVDKGVAIANKIVDDYVLSPLPDAALLKNLIACHHEFLDGSGYPRGLKQDEIPCEARIVTVADIFDALTSRRPYKNAWTVDAALTELDAMVARGKIDAHCVNALRLHRAEVEAIIEHYPDDR